MISARASSSRTAMIVFVDRADCHWLQPLRRGFRHCFVAMQHGDAWLICDSLKGHMELILLHPPKPFDLGRYYAGQGHRVLVGLPGPRLPGRGVTLAPLTCVTVAKRLLAIRAPGVWTPWQLFSHLLNAQPQTWRPVAADEQIGESSTRGGIKA